MPEFGRDGIERWTLTEHIQMRPSLYVGDRAKKGALCLIGMAVEVLIALVANREAAACFRHGASLDISLMGSSAEVAIDYQTDECPDFLKRCESLITNCDTLVPDECALHRGERELAPFPILCALSAELSICRVLKEAVEPVYPADPTTLFVKPEPSRTASVRAEFRIAQQIDPSALTSDDLKNFFEGDLAIPGLVASSVKVIRLT